MYIAGQMISEKDMAGQILDVFKKRHVYIQTDTEEDIKQVQNAYPELLRAQIGTS